MAITQAELDRVRLELETKITSVTVEHVSMAQAIGSYGERFTGVEARFTAVEARFDAVDFRIDALAADMDRRFDSLTNEMDRRFTDVRGDIARLDTRIDRLDSKLDARFNVQTVLMTVLGVMILFGDSLRTALGL
jgi:hypothetical protein